MDIVKKMPDKWIKELTSCVSEKGALFLAPDRQVTLNDWYDAENLRDFIKAKDEEIEQLRKSRNEILEDAALNAEGFGGSANDAKNYWAREISESIRELKEIA